MPIRRSPNGARHVRPQPGRNRPERVVAINRNAWSQSVGTGGRNHPVRAHWIGNLDSDNNTLVIWYKSGIKTIEDAKSREVTVGSTGDDPSSQYPKVMNALLGTKFKIVMGYPGANEINLAMERGEVAGRGSNSWASWKATKADWLRDKKINILVQIGLKKAEDLPDVPLLTQFATNAEDTAVLKLLSQPVAVGRPIFTTPGVPSDRVKALRDAFEATLKDPAFIEDAKKMNLPIHASSGIELQALVSSIVGAPKANAERLASILGAKGSH